MRGVSMVEDDDDDGNNESTYREIQLNMPWVAGAGGILRVAGAAHPRVIQRPHAFIIQPSIYNDNKVTPFIVDTHMILRRDDIRGDTTIIMMLMMMMLHQ